jgi:hypothetical protein
VEVVGLLRQYYLVEVVGTIHQMILVEVVGLNRLKVRSESAA